MQGPGEAGQSAERQEGWERKGLQGAARRLQAGRLERSQRLGVLGWAVAATLQSGYSLSLVCRRRLAVVDVPVWQGVGHRGALRGPGGKVLQQISKAKRRGGEHHHPYPSLSITSQHVAADKGTGLPPGLLWGPGWGPGRMSGCPWFSPASAAWCQRTPPPSAPHPSSHPSVPEGGGGCRCSRPTTVETKLIIGPGAGLLSPLSAQKGPFSVPTPSHPGHFWGKLQVSGGKRAPAPLNHESRAPVNPLPHQSQAERHRLQLPAHPLAARSSSPSSRLEAVHRGRSGRGSTGPSWE